MVMTKRATPGITALAAALLLTACGNNSTLPSQQGTLATTTTPPTPNWTPTYTAPPTPRIIQKTVGQWAGSGNSCGGTPQSCDLAFTITKITNCTGRYAGDPPPAGTTRKLVWLEVSLSSRYNPDDLPSYLITRFSAINAAGVTSGEINPSTS